MSNQQPPPSRPWLRLTSIARPTVPPAATPTAQPAAPPAATPVPPLVGSPTLRPALALPAFVRPAAPEPTPRPPPTASAPLTAPVSAPTPGQQPPPRIPVAQQPVPPPIAAITPTAPPPVPIVETSAAVSSTTAAPPTATSASVPTTPILKSFAPSASLPASPAKQLSPFPPPPPTVAPSSSLPASPAKKQSPLLRPPPTVSSPKTKLSSPAPARPMATAIVPNTKLSLKIIKPEAETPPHSHALKPVAPPPSPLKLPPPQIRTPDEDVTPRIPLEAEQKNVLFQKSVAAPEREIRSGDMIRSAGTQKPGIPAATVKESDEVTVSSEKGNGIIAKKKVESGEAGVKVIMIAGENKGATMDLARPAKNHRYRIGNNTSSSSSSSDEEKHGREGKGHKGKAPAAASLPMAAYANSNVQGINNSILYNSSCTHRDPGVHFLLTRKPAVGALPHMKEHKA